MICFGFWDMWRGNWTQSGCSGQSDRSYEKGGTRKKGVEVEESHEDEGVQYNGDTNHAVWQWNTDNDEEVREQTRDNRNGLSEKSRSVKDWQSKEYRREGGSETRGRIPSLELTLPCTYVHMSYIYYCTLILIDF